MSHSIPIASALFLFACGGSTLDVGSNQAGSSGKSDEVTHNGGSGGQSHRAGADSFGLAGYLTGSGGVPGDLTFAGGGPGLGGLMPNGGAAPTYGGGLTAWGGATVNTGGVLTGGGGETTGTSDPIVPQTCSKSLDQVWEGDTLDFFFNPQNDKWRIRFDGTEPNGRLCGTVTYVAAGQVPPTPATDPDVGYPPSYQPLVGRGAPEPGVTYGIIEGAGVGSAVHFRIAPNELWKDWCALQTPVPSLGGYACVGQDGGSFRDGTTCTIVSADGTTRHYPDTKCHLCLFPSVCSCSASECSAVDAEPIVFDLQVSSDGLSGTVNIAGKEQMILLRAVN